MTNEIRLSSDQPKITEEDNATLADDMTLSSDQPKIQAEEDKLGFAYSAEAVAKSILAGEHPDGFVLGIEGGWGSGKTTFINFVREHIEKKDSDFKIIEFKPWLHSSHENLIAAYFKLLKTEVPNTFSNNNAEKALATVIDIFTPVVGSVVSLTTGPLFGKPVKNAMTSFSDILKKMPPLETQYLIIRDELKNKDTGKKPKQHFLVIIDDLDRLDATEIRTMLKLVKSVGKLPYVTYILAYDREYVIKAIDPDMPNFLEKIIQLPIPLPKPTQNKLVDILREELKGFFKIIDDNNRHWKHLTSSKIFYYIKKPRDAYLLANSVKFCFPAMKKSLDPADFFTLETLRLFDKTLWNWIKDNRDILVGEDRSLLLYYNKDEYKHDVEKASEGFSQLSQNQRNILSLLFPLLTNTFGAEIIAETKEIAYEMRNRGGIGLKSVYDAYFAQYLDGTEVSKDDIDSFIKNTSDKEKTTEILQNWINTENSEGVSKIINFLELVSYRFIGEQSQEPTRELLLSLCGICNDSNFLENDSTQQQLLRTFETLFEKMGTDKTTIFFKSLCNDFKHIAALTFLLYYMGVHLGKIHIDGKEIEQKFSFITDEDWEVLIKTAHFPLQRLFTEGTIGEFPSIYLAEHLLVHIAGVENAQSAFTKGYRKSDSYTIRSIKKYLELGKSVDGSDIYIFRIANYPDFFDCNVLLKYAETIDLETQDSDTQQAIMAFTCGMEEESYDQ